MNKDEKFEATKKIISREYKKSSLPWRGWKSTCKEWYKLCFGGGEGYL